MKWQIFIVVLLFTNSLNASLKSDMSSGMVYKHSYETYDGFAHTKHNEYMINYKLLSDDIVSTIFKGNEAPKRLIVTDFVNLITLKNESSMGYILSNSLKNALLNTYETKIVEVELSKNFKFSGNGLRLLSRNINNIKNIKFDVKKALVGTFTYSKTEIIVFVKLIDLKTGLMEGSYTKSLPLGSSVKEHLSIK